jgi:hypothetical protein
MRCLRLFAVALLALSLSLARPVAAQTTCTTNGCALINTITVNVPVVVQLDISTVSTALSAPSNVNYGTVASPGTPTSDAGPTLTVHANRSWTLSVSAPAAFTPGGASTYNKPSGDVQVVNGATVLTLGTATQTIASGSATASTPAAVTYKTKYVWTLDTPGSYSLAVSYTLTAP